MEPYPPEVEDRMCRFYNSLNEKDRRRFAGLEALRFGCGGRSYIAGVLGCSRNTVSKGAREVSGLPTCEVEQRIRKTGGGRKRYAVTWGAVLDEKFLTVLRDHTAGDPMDETVRWTNLTPSEIVKALRAKHDIAVSKYVVYQLLKKHNYRRRKAQKKTCLKPEIKNRNEQFENIVRFKAEFAAAGNPVVSMDTKKKEYIGNFYRDGHLYTLAELHTYDHDFHSYAEGVIIPHSLYDMQFNVGYIQLGNSHDTGEFACDSFSGHFYLDSVGQGTDGEYHHLDRLESICPYYCKLEHLNHLPENALGRQCFSIFQVLFSCHQDITNPPSTSMAWPVR